MTKYVNAQNKWLIREEYSGTGVQEDIFFAQRRHAGQNTPSPSISAQADTINTSDVFTVEEKIGGRWVKSISSSNGAIGVQRITGRNEGVRLNITTNASGAIALSATG